MIGNKNGWLIAAGIGIVSSLITLMIVLSSAFGSGSSPTSATLKPGVLDVWDVSKPISSVVDTPPSGGDNAGDDYARAIRLLSDSKDQITQFRTAMTRWEGDARALTRELSGEPDDVKYARIQELVVTFPPAVEQILRYMAEGAGKGEMKYVLIHTGQQLTVSRDIEATRGFTDLAKLTIAVADYYIYRGDPAPAVAPLQNMCAMGWHMFNERAHIGMMYKGLIVQNDAARMLQYPYNMLGQDDQANRAAEYQRAVEDLIDDFKDKRDIIMPPADEKRMANPGDVFNVVRNDKDRAWRVQGILALGVLKLQPMS